MHTHSAAATARPRLVIALVLSATVFVVEAVAAAFASSLALFAEAFHVLIDVVALAIAVVAVWLAARPTSERRTFGMLRLAILATVLNTGLLFLVAIVALIVPRGWRLLREALDVLLEATPRGVDLDVLRTHIRGCAGVTDVHDLHVWTITSGLNVISAHVVVDRHADPAAVLDSLGGCLAGDFDIEHSTFQLESE